LEVAMNKKRSETPFLYRNPGKAADFTTCKFLVALRIELACYKERRP